MEIKVTADGYIGDHYFFDTNQTARPANLADPNQATIVAGKVEADQPNASMADAHAEIGVIQQAYNAGLTQGQDMTIVVRGETVCSYCAEQLGNAADASGLNSLTVVNTAQTGKGTPANTTKTWTRDSDGSMTSSGWISNVPAQLDIQNGGKMENKFRSVDIAIRELSEQEKILNRLNLQRIEKNGKIEDKYFIHNRKYAVSFNASYIQDDKLHCIDTMDFSVDDMYRAMENALSHNGDASIRIRFRKDNKPKHLYQLSMNTIAKGRYTLTLSYNTGDCYFRFWEPNNNEYAGDVLNNYDDPTDLRMTSSEIKYAQIAFYELYRYGKLSDSLMVNFHLLSENKPKYYLVPTELLEDGE